MPVSRNLKPCVHCSTDARAVPTGVSDGNYIEITSGLQEGDVVAYIPTTSSSGGMAMMMGGMPGGMGGMGGAMPGGGPGGR